MRFMRIDSGSLKQVLMGHCEAWVAKFTGLLLSMAAAELRSLHDFFKESREQLAIVPSNLDQLAEVVNLQRRLVDEKRKVEARFEPLREKYRVLDKFSINIPEDQGQCRCCYSLSSPPVTNTNIPLPSQFTLQFTLLQLLTFPSPLNSHRPPSRLSGPRVCKVCPSGRRIRRKARKV